MVWWELWWGGSDGVVGVMVGGSDVVLDHQWGVLYMLLFIGNQLY